MNVHGLNGFLLVLISAVALAKSNPVPLINQPLVPDSVKPGHKAFTLTVNGTGFAPDALIYWNGSSRVTQFVSSSRLKATINAADVAKVGTAAITVANSAKGKAVSNVVYFPVRRPSPSVALARGTNFLDYGETVVGDFNNDGKPDAAMCSSVIEVFLGNGDGTFQPAITTDAQTTLDYVITADFNGDGNLDLVGSDGNGGVYMFLGQGNGKFTALQPFGALDNGVWLAAADFNRDGKMDLYFAGEDSNGPWFFIYPGNGDGTFATPIRGQTGESVGAPAIGDFNHDGNLDLAIPDQNNVDVFLGNGDGTFGSYVAYPAGVGNRGVGFVATADLNHDGALDLVTDGVCVLFGDRNGSFTNQGCIDVGGNSPAVSIGDFNGDGELDVAVSPVTYSGELLAILLGSGGQLQKPIELQICGGGCQSLFGVADFDNDGGLDIATGSNGYVYFQAPASLAPGTLDFGNQQVGTSSQPQNATLTNVSSSKLRVGSIKITGVDSKDFSQTNNCGKSLPPGGSCQIQVTFKPKQQGSRSASLTVAYGGLGSPQTVTLSGVGTLLAVSVTPSKLKFPTQVVNTTSSPETATLTNTGTDVVNISDISTTGPFSQTNNCPSTLPVGANCQIQVKFKPTNKGLASGKLSVADNAQGSPQTATLSGTGTYVKLSAKNVNFGNQQVGTSSSPVPIKLTNKGNTVLNIRGIKIGGNNSADFSETNDCGDSVPAGGDCTITVTFTPTAQGQRSASLEISDDGGASPQKVALLGTGT